MDCYLQKREEIGLSYNSDIDPLTRKANQAQQQYPSIDEIFANYEKSCSVSEMPSGDMVGNEYL